MLKQEGFFFFLIRWGGECVMGLMEVAFYS